MACFNSIVINAPVDKVWEKIKDFHDFSWAPNVISKCEQVGDKSGTQVGAKRILNDAFHETLIDIDEAEYRFQYSIDDGPSPLSKEDVKNYKGDIYLIPITNNTTVMACKTSWQSATDDSATEGFCNPIYAAILDEVANYLS